MKNAYQQQHTEKTRTILAALPKNADAQLKEFVRQFYAKVLVSDLDRTLPLHAIALAESAYDFMQKREADTPKIRIFTPEKREHGYDCKHTVIELLNDDMPFLVDSLSAELTRLGFSIRETIHPIFTVKRDAKGKLLELLPQGGDEESFIHFEISPLPEGVSAEQLTADLELVLRNIRATVEDWPATTEKAKASIKKIEGLKNYFPAEIIAEVKDFLQWLINKNFIFLGYAEYDFYDSKGREALIPVPGSKLGVLKLGDDENPQGLEALPPEMRHFLLVPQLIEITKSNRRSVVHRPVPMDYIGLKRFDAKGKIIGEARFLGLFTSSVYYQSAELIPFARQKMAQVLERATFDETSHDGKSLKAILEFLPRDEIFQMSPDDLFEVSMGILALEAKPGVRVFVRNDAFERFVSVMIFVPREKFSTSLRRQIQAIAEKAFGGVTSSFSTQIIEAPLARLHLIVKTTPGNIPKVDIAELEQEIAKCAYLWSDLLQSALMEKYGEARAEAWQRTYAHAFPQNYIDTHDAAAAAYDIKKIEEALAVGGLVLDVFRSKAEGENFWHLKIYNPNEEIALSDILPMLENAGFRVIEERPFMVVPHGVEGHVWIRDFKLQVTGKIDLEAVKLSLEEAMLKVWNREMESDRFNALVIEAGLNWRQVTLLRAVAKYLKQVGLPYSQTAIEAAFTQNPQIAKNIVALFEARFDLKEKASEARQKQLAAAIEKQLGDVSNAVQDLILRRYGDIVEAMLRTNYFQTDKDGNHKPVLSFKFDSKLVPELPKPWPYAEIFVYGTRVEGIHLRGGKVARGGLRWSDRPEDFRTEVLGLMKAQMVKNSVIVPVGSKGGFVVKRPTISREAFMEEGIACYKLYLSGLLDITDNIVKGKITPPSQTVRQDGDDPYLVVAADKGTATFSDIANSVSEQYGFWLGDAFASGGSAGYDHKAMAITAKGAWVSVTCHFRDMGVDIARQDFTVCGIGDMAGDVFGNGMLLSEHIRLVAAFNHMHIFLDPFPDAKSSFAERKRLFKLPRSSWKDYDTTLISAGGGVFERSAKSIPLSKEAQAALGVSKASMTPDELIRTILLAPVDLLWNGGIGTYVKAEEESHDQVGDRANNAVRLNGKELRCKVVGEGGNLGFTQKGRIEYAKNGGRINTDAIDNSAGVDCSDHEVNIKIAFSHEVAGGKLTIGARDKLLVAMTDEVARLVLKDNILQTQAITTAQIQGVRHIESQARLMLALEKTGLLDRGIEFLPTDQQMADLKAARKGLTRPELAVLLAYSKMALYKELLESTLPDEAYFVSDLKRYFPKAMQEQFANAITRHPLKREIIATVMTNSIVNRAGITFSFDLAENLGAGSRDIAAAYAVTRDAFGLRALWDEIEKLPGNVSTATRGLMIEAIGGFLTRVTAWLLRNVPQPLDIAQVTKEITPAIADMEKFIAQMHADESDSETRKFSAYLAEQAAPHALSEKIARLELMASAPDIIAVARKNKMPVATVGKVYFELDTHVGLGWLRVSAGGIAVTSRWERLALQALIGDLYDEQRRLTDAAVSNAGNLKAWLEAHKAELEKLAHFMQDLRTSGATDLSKLTLALKHIRALG